MYKQFESTSNMNLLRSLGLLSEMRKVNAVFETI